LSAIAFALSAIAFDPSAIAFALSALAFALSAIAFDPSALAFALSALAFAPFCRPGGCQTPFLSRVFLNPLRELFEEEVLTKAQRFTKLTK